MEVSILFAITPTFSKNWRVGTKVVEWRMVGMDAFRLQA
jgi:hypothetical protein